MKKQAMQKTPHFRYIYIRKVISLTKALRDELITSLYCNTLPKSLAIADLGCSSGPNTLLVISEFIKVVENLCRKFNQKSPEYKVSLNDLPGNDFNSVPEGVDNHNKGNIYLSTTSPSNVLKAYYKQFQNDFSIFLACRVKELVEGGCMILTFMGRQNDDPSNKECCYIWDLMTIALKDMVLLGIIEEEKLDTFNIPNYYPSPSEVKLEVLKEGSFAINKLEISEVNWNAVDHWEALDIESEISKSFKDDGYNMAQCMRAVTEPLLVCHFGDSVIEEIFERYKNILTDRMPKERTKFTNLTLSLTRKP
ncbi:hypothetical protein RYX36_025507 [Vicia faba]